MKKGKLYTVTPWNKQALVKAEPLPTKNLFYPGGDMNNGGIGNYSGQNYQFTMAPTVNDLRSSEISIPNYTASSSFQTSNPSQINYGTGAASLSNNSTLPQNTGSLNINSGGSNTGGGKGKSKGMSAGAQQAIALGASALGSIDTGERRGMWDTLDPVHHLAGGRETGFGNAMEDAGVALTQAGLSSGNYYLAIAGAAAKVVGGLSNAAFGYKIENEKSVKDNINRLASTNYNADDYDTLLSQDAAMGGRNRVDLGEVKNGWFNSKGTKKAKKLEATQDWALAFGDNSFENAEKNIQQKQLENALRWYGTTDFNRNQSAYGGPLDMKDNNIFDMGGGFNDDMPITNFGFISDYLTTKRKQAEQKNVLGNMFAGAPNSMFAVGGKFGGGSFYGSGAGGGWDETSTDTYNVDNFNQAFDMAVADGLKEFIFQGRKYNTQKEKNPVREYNNRWVGQGRRANKKNPSKAYDHQAGPLGGPLADIPMVVDTYVGTPERPPQLEYDPNAMERGKALPYSWSNTVDRVKRIKPMKAFGGPLFAIGGDLQTNGSDWSTGLTHVDAGQSHEMNPYDGVQMGVDSQGVPNLVEEGEVIFNDYVYSQRITLDKDAKEKLHFPKKQDITYADAAKKLEREIKERPNDPISQAGFEAQMGDLAEEQERQKAEMEAAKAQEAFDSLSDEEKVAVMQQAAQREQAMQEQAMAEQAAAQQQPTPEEMAMMEQQAAQEQMMAQQAAPQGIPEEAMTGAYGGLINRFDLGGLAWVKKNHPEVKNPQAVAKALEKMMQENKSNYYRPDSTSMFGNNNNKKYSWDFKSAWNEMSPSVKSLSAYERSLNKWVKYGLSREDAFRVSHPDSYYKGYRGDLGTERKRDYDAAYKRLVKDYKQPAAAPKPQVRTSVQQQGRTKIPTYINSKGEKFHIGEDGKYYHSEKAALIANDKYRKSIPTYTNSNGEMFYVGDNGSYYRNIDAAVSSNTKYRRAKAAQQQAPVEEAPTRSAYRPPVDEAAANAEPTVRQVVERSNTSTSTSGTQTAKGASPSKGVNVGEWNIDKPWDKYGLPGAEQYVLSQFADYDTLSDEDKKQRVLDTVNGLNSIQESYWNNVVPLIGRKRQEWNEGVGQHQKQYHQMTGNVGFRQTDDSGQLLLDTDLTKPTGYYTGDSPKGEWVDYRSGPQTEQRYFGATGDNVQNLVDTLRRVGIDFSPYQDWTIGSGDNARQLYRASLLDAADNGAASNTPVQNNDGVVPVREEDYTLTEDELEAAGKKLDAQAKSGQGYVVSPDNEDWDLKPIHKQDWMRYAGIFGPAVGLGMQALGIGKPDASGIMAAANAASGPAHLATPHVIGDYMRYKPIDRLFEGNRILASSRATDRNLMNTSGGNRGTAMAGLLANGYNTQIALGNADMQAENVNWGRYGQTKDFNRGTNQFNAQALNQNSQFNADALNRQRQYAAQMQMQAAAQKADMDAAWYNGIYGNVAGLFKGIGDVGRENAQHNTVADMIASGIFGTMKKQPIANGFVEVVPKRSSAAKGGKIKRKKNKRGLTF